MPPKNTPASTNATADANSTGADGGAANSETGAEGAAASAGADQSGATPDAKADGAAANGSGDESSTKAAPADAGKSDSSQVDSVSQSSAPATPKLLRQVVTKVLNLSTFKYDEKHEVVGEELPQQPPESLTLAGPFGFYDEDNNLHMWQANQVITDSSEMMTLIERGAVFKPDAQADGVQ
jgi:hypothetical protein